MAGSELLDYLTYDHKGFPQHEGCSDPWDRGKMPQWCGHMAELLKNNDDVKPLMDELTSTDVVDSYIPVMVPVVPSHGVWAQFRIVRYPRDDKKTLYPMVWHYQSPVGWDKEFEMGLWSPGDGRYTMRILVWEYVKTYLNEDPPHALTEKISPSLRCPSRTHTTYGQKQLREAVGFSAMLNRYFLAVEKACLECVEQTMGEDGLAGLNETFRGRFNN